MEDSLVLALGWFAGMMVFALALGSALRSSVVCRRSLQEAARALGGRVMQAEFGERPRLDFVADEIPAEFVYSPGPWARVRFCWAAPGRLRIHPRGVLGAMSRMFRAHGDARYSVPELEPRYQVEGGPEAWIAEVLDEEACARVLALAAVGAAETPIPVRVDVGASGLTVFYKGNPASDHAVLHAFLSEATGLFRALRGTSGTLVQLTRTEEIAADGRCPVCGVGLEGPLRRCARCRTLHHDECWEYFGSCAMYGCLTRRGERVRVEIQ